MAKFSATTIVLLCLFTLSTAQTSPDDDGNTTQVALPHHEFTTTLRLPSEPSNTETDPGTAVETSVPLTKTTFRSVNHRFPVRSKKRCHHYLKVSPAVRENEVVLHGDEQRVPRRWVKMHRHHHDEDSDSDSVDEEQWVPRRWVNVHRRHHDEDSDSDSDDDEDRTEKKRKRKVALKGYDFEVHGREELKGLRRMDEKKKKGCFFKRLRKFLDHYF